MKIAKNDPYGVLSVSSQKISPGNKISLRENGGKSRFRELPTDEINKMLEKKIISVAITTATNFGLNSFNGTYNISEVFL